MLDKLINKLNNWLIYSFLLGIFPILLRLYVYYTDGYRINQFSETDFAFFGLAVAFSNINEIIYIFSLKTIGDKTRATNIVFIIINSAFLLFFGILSQNILAGETGKTTNYIISVIIVIVLDVGMVVASILYFINTKDYSK